MLEGQVAVLSSGGLAPDRSADLLEAIFQSRLYRAELDTFLLQPMKRIPPILEKGVVPREVIERYPLLERLLESGDRRLVEKDEDGVVRFSSVLVNGRDVIAVLDGMSSEPGLAEHVDRDRSGILDDYESIFDHRSFTGRSGGMYGYEGIGCTYWHMVAKLLVAAGECALEAEDHDDPEVLARLRSLYIRIRDGLGFRMDAARFGALPIDAYSHSDGRGHAKQPGMTGQVKEELITRRMELGVLFEPEGIRFSPTLLPESEWTTEPTAWPMPGFDGEDAEEIMIPARGIGFQCLGVPVVLRRAEGDARIEIHRADGEVTTIEGNRLDRESTGRLIRRDRSISRLEVRVGS
jgi:hypothetical protein